MKYFITLPILLLLLYKVKCDNGYYTAAVVEFSPAKNGSTEEIIKKNTDSYVKLLKDVEQKLDIVVFPELTLLKFVYDESYINFTVSIKVNSTPCNNSDSNFTQYLKDISCIAKEKQVYVVINIYEKEKCEGKPCARNGYNVYNTDVVFDRNGTIITKYRKFNLFGEAFTNKTKEPEIVFFKTDFNVTFGIFTCFDLLFESPPLELIKRKVSHFVFPTLWFAELPFLSATQVQQMWAQENNAVLLAANGNNNTEGSGGSGIYAGKNGPLVMELTSDYTQKIYIADVPKNVSSNMYNVIKNETNIDELSENMDKFNMIIDPSLANFTSAVLNISKNASQIELCHGTNKLCCNYDIEINVNNNTQTNHTSYTYLMVVFSGMRTFDQYNGKIQACGIIACLNSNLSSCGKRFPYYKDISWPVTFTKINITGNFSTNNSSQQYPNSLLSSIRPIHPNETEWITKKLNTNTTQRTHLLKEQQNRLLTFGIYGRDFSVDDSDNDENSSSKMQGLNLLIILFIYSIIKLF